MKTPMRSDDKVMLIILLAANAMLWGPLMFDFTRLICA